jgi:hypothetical protein
MVSKKEDDKESKELEIDDNKNENEGQPARRGPYIKGQEEEEESTINYEDAILTPSKFQQLPN